MALSFAHGAIHWLAADAATTVYTVSGLSFQPKAIRFYWQGLHSATDTSSTATNLRRGVGFATSTSDRRCVASGDTDAAGTMACIAAYRTDAVAVTNSLSTGTVDGLLDLNTITSDGFTLIVDDQVPANLTVFWEAWGGTDITVAVTGEIAEPAATGDVDYTVTGFVAGNNGDQVVMLAGVNSAGTAPFGVEQDSGLCIGAATSGVAGENIVITGNNDEASANAETDCYALDGECLAQIVQGGGNPNARATLTQFGTNNFRLNWIARNTTGRKTIFLAIKGGAWKAGSLTINTTSASATATVSSLAFQPVGVLLMSTENAEDTAGTASAQDYMLIGTGSSTSSRRTMGCHSNDGAAASEVTLKIEYDQILASPTSGSLYDLNAINSDGFQLIVDTAAAGESSSTWIGYLTFGSASTARTLTADPGLFSLTGTDATLKAGYLVSAQGGSVVLAGTAATVTPQWRVTADPGSVALTGTAATLRGTFIVDAQAGSVAIAGTAATVTPQWRVTADAGSVALTGTTATLTAQYKVSADAGSYVITGTDATLETTGGEQPSLTASAGSVAVTGTDTDLLYTTPHRKYRYVGLLLAERTHYFLTMPAVAGSWTITGTAAALLLKPLVQADAGAVALTGTDASLRLAARVDAASGAVVITGTDATLSEVGAFGITAEPGTVTVTGTAATLTPVFHRSVSADAGTVAVTGTDASVVAARRVAADAGTLSLTGTAATLDFRRGVTAQAGAVTVTGTAADLRGTFVLPASAGTVTITGTDAALSSVGAFSLTAESGAVALTGTASTLAAGYMVQSAAGSVAVTGTASVLAPARVVTADSGTVSVTGQAATTTKRSVLAADVGSVTTTGSAVSLAVTRGLVAGAGTITITGTAALLVETGAFGITAESGALTATGTAATLARSFVLESASGSTILTGTAADFFHPWVLVSTSGTVTVTAPSLTLKWSGEAVPRVSLSGSYTPTVALGGSHQPSVALPGSGLSDVGLLGSAV